MKNAVRRWIVKSHLRQVALAGRPVGAGMAIFLDDFIGEKILLDGGFDLEELRCLETSVFPYVRKGAVALDIGANIGNHARFFSRFFARVYAFEPHPRAFGLLSANAYGRAIVPLNYGLSDRAGRFPIEENQANLGASRISNERTDTGLEYEVRSLDDITQDVIEGDIGFVKIDVEGHEAHVIRGASQTLQVFRPIITFEVLAEKEQQREPQAVQELRAIGYEHFYRLVPQAVWKKMRPSILSRLLRAFSRLRGTQAFEGLQMVPFEPLGAGEVYAVLIASADPLPSATPA